MKKELDLINMEFVTKSDYTEFIEENEDETLYDVKKGEKIKIIGYDNETKKYTILNLSLDVPNAWFIAEETILDFILRRNIFKDEDIENIKASHIKEELVGKCFNSKKGFQKKQKGINQLIKVGEKVKVISYNKDNNKYTIMNTNACCLTQLIQIDDSEMDYLLRRGKTL